MLYEYQNTGLTKFAFCKLLILKDCGFEDQSCGKNKKMSHKKEKRDQGPALQIKLSTGSSVADYKKKSIGKKFHVNVVGARIAG
jgi:hypothetical protein